MCVPGASTENFLQPNFFGHLRFEGSRIIAATSQVEQAMQEGEWEIEVESIYFRMTRIV